jgi:hypothetical protein
MRVKGKDYSGQSVLCGGSYEKSQAVCNQGTISDPDTEEQVKGNQSMVRERKRFANQPGAEERYMGDRRSMQCHDSASCDISH